MRPSPSRHRIRCKRQHDNFDRQISIGRGHNSDCWRFHAAFLNTGGLTRRPRARSEPVHRNSDGVEAIPIAAGSAAPDSLPVDPNKELETDAFAGAVAKLMERSLDAAP